jgi:hypothetical protein
MEYITEGACWMTSPNHIGRPSGPPNRDIRGFKNKETKLDDPCEFTFQWLWYVAGFFSGILLSIVFVVNH